MNPDNIVGLAYADRLRITAAARHKAIGDYFHSEWVALTSLMGPMSEGPDWPAGPAWLAVGSGERACIVSDGLSDPWVERQRGDIGLGLEVFIETSDAGIPADAPLASLANTWLFPMVAEVSHILASYPRLCEKLLTGELLSLEFNIDHLKDGRGPVGVLLGLAPKPAAVLSLPGGEVSLVAATLLKVAELRYLRGKGESGRRELAGKLKTTGTGRLSLLHRQSLV